MNSCGDSELNHYDNGRELFYIVGYLNAYEDQGCGDERKTGINKSGLFIDKIRNKKRCRRDKQQNCINQRRSVAADAEPFAEEFIIGGGEYRNIGNKRTHYIE